MPRSDEFPEPLLDRLSAHQLGLGKDGRSLLGLVIDRGFVAGYGQPLLVRFPTNGRENRLQVPTHELLARGVVS